jgi:hypothetical protein
LLVAPVHVTVHACTTVNVINNNHLFPYFVAADFLYDAYGVLGVHVRCLPLYVTLITTTCVLKCV